MRRVLLISAVLTWLSCETGRAVAGLALTGAASADGFSLSVFADRFPVDVAGPLGIAFPNSGGVLVTDAPGNVRFFSADTDGQHAGDAPIGQFYGFRNAAGLATVGSNIYMTEAPNGKVVQINADGTLNQTIVTGFPEAAGLVANPANGHLFFSTLANGQIIDLDPVTRNTSVFASAIVDGLSISADGKFLYGANTSSGSIVGYDTTSKAIIFDSGFISGGIDGTALGLGTLAGNIFVNTNGGTLVEVNLTTKAQTLIASGGSRGDFVSVDPNDGSLLLAQLDSVLRLTAPRGGGFGPGPAVVPEPSTFVLSSILFGIFSVVWSYKRFRSIAGALFGSRQSAFLTATRHF